MDLRREIRWIDRQHAWHHRNFGETVMWYAYDRDASTYHELPGNEGTRRYKQGVPVPVFAASQVEGEQTQTEGGNLPLQFLHLTISYKALSRTGIMSPTHAEGHLYDIVYYDGNYFDIRRVHLLGRLRRDLIIAIDAVQIFPSQEWQFTAMLTGGPGVDPSFGQAEFDWDTFSGYRTYGDHPGLMVSDADAMRAAVIGGTIDEPPEEPDTASEPVVTTGEPNLGIEPEPGPAPQDDSLGGFAFGSWSDQATGEDA